MKKKGFTLIELMIVVSIIALLVTLIIIYLRTQTLKGNDAKRKTDIRKIQVAVEEYEKDHNCYPLSTLMSCNPGTGLTPYLDKIPCDPTTSSSYYYEYQDSSCPNWYRIYTKLDNIKDTSVVVGIGPYASYNYSASSPDAPNVTGTSGSGGSGSSAAPTSGPGGGGSQEIDYFYGCKSGACVVISWDTERPGPECDPNYQNSTCYGQCNLPSAECVSWR